MNKQYLYSAKTRTISQATARHISKQAEKNDTLLVEARMIDKFGLNYMKNLHAINLQLKIQGLGVGDDRVKSREFCVRCGWRMMFMDEMYRCSGCDLYCAPSNIKLNRKDAHLARQKSLAEARIITGALPKRPYGTDTDRDGMNFR